MSLGRAKNKEYEMAIKIAGKIEKSFYESTKLTRKELREIAREAAAQSENITKSFRTGMKDVEPVFSALEKAGKKAFHAVREAALIAATAVTAVVGAAIAVGAPFEAQMSTVQALSGATVQELEQLEEKAKEIGASTQFTATEVGQAMEYMAMAGWKTNNMLEGISGVMNLAAASGEDLAVVSDIVTDSMTAFNMKAEEAGHFSDVLAAAATNSNTTVSGMGEAFTYAASLAGALGYSIEDVALATGLMANSGIKESKAGTALRKIFSETTGGAKVAAAAFGEMTIATANSDGSMRELKSVIDDLRGAFSQMTEEEKAANAEAIAGKTGMSGLLAIVNAAEEDYNKLSEALNDCSGAAAYMAKIRLDNLSGDVTIAKSAMEGLGIQIYEDLNPLLREGVQEFTRFIGVASKELKNSNVVSQIVTGIRKNLPSTIRNVKEFAKSLLEFASPLIRVGEWCLGHPDVIASVIIGIGTSLAAYRVTEGVMKFTDAMGKLSAILTNPWAAAILAVGAAIGGVAGIGFYIMKCANDAKKANLAEHFGKIHMSMEELEKAAGHIIQTDNLGKVREMLNQFEEMEAVRRDIDETVDILNRMNWKVSIGMELDEGERYEYQQEIQTYISNVQDYLEQGQYAVNLAVTALTDDDLEGQNIITKINEFYSGKQQELANLGTQLNETVTEAFQDGLLDMDEVKEITELQNQMAKIQAAVAGSNFDAELEVLGTKYGGELDAESYQNLVQELNEQVTAASADYEEALKLSIANATVMMNDGAIDQTEYADMIKEYKENYLEQVGEIQLKASGFQTETLKQQYAEEISAAAPALQNAIGSKLDEIMTNDDWWNTYTTPEDWVNGLQNVLYEAVSGTGLDGSTRAAFAELYKQMEPSREQMESLAAQYAEMGKEVPEQIRSELSDMNMVAALSGNENAIWEEIGKALGNNETYAAVISAAESQGAMIPEALADAMYAGQPEIREQADAILDEVKKQFEEGIDVTIPISYSVIAGGSDSGNISHGKGRNIARHADGGIFNEPHLGWVAEAGMESIIPIDGSRNAVNLWEETGQMLGMFGKGNGTGLRENSFGQLYNEMPLKESGNRIEFNPTLQFYGNVTSKEDVSEAMNESMDRFERMMNRLEKEQKRMML